MGIHNSSYLSIVWRVANHDMKAFVTICALMAGSASAESQHMVSFSQPLAIPANPLTSYSVYSPPLHPVSYANLQVPQVPLQVEPLSYKVPLVTEVPLPVERMTYRLEHPLNTLLGHRFIKREAEPETSYVIKSKVDNPEDGTKYALDVQVDRNGHGHSHQQIERQGALVPLRDNYLMDRNVNDQRRRDQIRRAQNVLEQMMMERNDQGQMRQMDQRQMDQMENRQMDQRQMGRTMHRDRLSNQRMRDQERMDTRMYSRMGQMNQMGQKSQMENGRMEQSNQRNQNGMRQMTRMEMQMQTSRMTKREAEPSFEYNVAAEHPSAQTEYRVGQDMVNRMYENEMGQRMRNEMMRGQDQMDSRRMSKMDQMNRMSQMENGQMDQMNQRNQNGLRQMSRMDMQMQSRRMTKREAEPSFKYTIAAEHPSAQTEYGMGHDMVNNQNKMGVMSQRMSNQMMIGQDKMDSMRYSTMGQMELRGQNTMGMLEQRMVNTGMRQMDGNLLSQRDNMMIRDNRMQSPRMVKREADGSLAYTVSVSHPSEQSRRGNQPITYQMPYVNYSFMRTMLQGHPDGGVSYLGPSMTMPYPMTPVNMRTGSRVVVQKDGQGYAAQTRA